MSIRVTIAITACTVAILWGFDPAAADGAGDPGVSVSFTESSQSHESVPPVTAVGLRHPAPAALEPAATDVLVLIDTSASQTGTFRTRSEEVVHGILAQARPRDQLFLAAVDIDCEPLSESFSGADGDDIRQALLALGERTPLGDTDIATVLEKAAEMFGPSARPRSIIYVGDGPGLAGVEAPLLYHVTEKLRSKRIMFSAVGVGPRVNWPCLAAVANATGGVLLVPDETAPARDAGRRISGFAIEPVWWPEEASFTKAGSDAPLLTLPARMPPLRRDRDSVVLVEAALDGARLELTLVPSQPTTAPMSPVSIDVPPSAPRADNAYLEELVRNAAPTGGIFLPTLGREGLELAKNVIRGEADALTSLSKRAESAGAHGSALRLATAALRRDPDNAEASVVRSVAAKQLETPFADEPAADTAEALPAPRPTDDRSAPSTAAEAASSELADLAAMRKIRAQAIQQEAAVRLRAVRKLMTTDPDAAREELKELQRLIRASTDLDTAARDRLDRQLEISIRESVVRSREKVECDLAAERKRAIGRERMRLDNELVRREERIKQLAARYNALIEEGLRIGYNRPERYPTILGDNTGRYATAQMENQPPTTVFTDAERRPAERLGEEAPDLYANHPVPMPARVLARMAPIEARIHDHVAENWRTKRDQERGFMDAMHLVEVAAIPLPDEPPVYYPSADRWRDMTAKREKYKSVDLKKRSPNETKIYEALENPIEPLEFTETPLRDVIAQLRDAQGIPIQPDLRALEDAGIDLDTPITGTSVSGASLRSTIKQLLDGVDLTYLVQDDAMLITTKDKAAENLILKVYPVGDLVIPATPFSGGMPGMGGAVGGGGIGMGMGGMGMGGMGMGGMGMGGMGGGMFQVADARDRIAANTTQPPATAAPQPPVEAQPPVNRGDLSLPAEIVEAEDLREAIAAYLGHPAATSADDSDEAMRALAVKRARLRASAAQLGKEGRFDRAADLISAAIASGHAEPWMYEALALALEAAGRPRGDAERAILSAADFATTPRDLIGLAHHLARFGSTHKAFRLCREAVSLDSANREAYALAMMLAAKENDLPALLWSCSGVLAHDWPAPQQDLPARANRLVKTSVEALRQQGKMADADAFQTAIDQSRVRDVEFEISWNGDADLDLLVEEPSGMICSLATPRSTGGGALMADTDVAFDASNATQRERYVAAQAFPGVYRMLIRRATGAVAAGTVTAELVLHRGTPHEQRVRRQLPLGADELLLTVEVPEGRRRQPLFDAQVMHDAQVQHEVGRAILAQQLADMTDPEASQSLSQSRGQIPPQAGGLPFFGGSPVGYQPVVQTLSDTTSLSGVAIVSSDRRYVRVSMQPFFSGVGQVSQFNTSSGGGAGGGGAGGMGGGMPMGGMGMGGMM